tara:strand:+ start:1431 stop:2321 length:891 start_codon:yes stop_codon:yes gene_type:complete
MAPFNKRQIGYIKAIADVGGHTTYKRTQLNAPVSSGTLAKFAANTTHDGLGKYAFVSIGAAPKVYTSGSTDTKHTISDSRSWFHELPVYSVTVNTDEAAVTTDQRVTPECYLESVHARMRLIQELDVSSNEQSHQEYRMLVFRHKERQCSDERYAENFSNPLYDMFLAADNYKTGPLGYRKKSALDSGVNDYAGYDWDQNNAQALMTCMTNKEDYVFMKDVRFYLGKEYGGKHIYEDTLHWDHADPIATEATDLTHNESNNKNYTWYIAVFCHTNGSSVADFPYMRFDTTTHVTSG